MSCVQRETLGGHSLLWNKSRAARWSLGRVFLLFVIPLCGQIAPRLRHLQQPRLITGIGGLGGKRNALLGVLEIVLDRRHAPPALKNFRLQLAAGTFVPQILSSHPCYP